MFSVGWLGKASLTRKEQRKGTPSLRWLRSGREWIPSADGRVNYPPERGPPSPEIGGRPTGTVHSHGCHVANVHQVADTVDSHPFYSKTL